MQIEMLIKEIRTERKMTLKKLSMLSGVSITYINELENNLKCPSIITIEMLSKALKVDIKELYRIKN